MAIDEKRSEASRAGVLMERALRDLQYGSVEFVVHDGRVVQVERREKLRVNVSTPITKEADA